MARRSRKRSGWYLSRGRLLLLIIVICGVVYLYYHPEILSRVDLPTVELPTSPPAQSTAAVPTVAAPTARTRATRVPAATAQPNPAPTGSTDTMVANSGEWYQLFFTRPRYPDNKAAHKNGIDTQLVALLNSARTTIDLADYDFDLENVAQAMAAAAARGVRVRMVTDTDTLTSENKAIQNAFAILKKAKIPIVDDQRPAIMHDKFVVVDSATVWTGSWNFTDGDTYRLNNNAIRIASPALAENYTLEFEKMFTQRQFGPSKQGSQRDPVITIGGARVENYFAPEDKVATQIVKRLQMAAQSIHFMAFSFTNDAIGAAMRARAKAGVQVAGVFETTGSETQYSEYGSLRRAKLDVLQDGNPYAMHHKVIIIDSKTVIFGSFNFTDSADQSNDENLLIIDDPTLAQAFEAEYERVRGVALAKNSQGITVDPSTLIDLDTAESKTIE